jgi:hypothetical protein
MTDEKKETNNKEAQEMLYLEQRQAINNAYSSLEGQAVAESFSAFTFEEAADAQIERIEGPGTQIRPNLLVRTESIRLNVLKAIEQIKEVPPEVFFDVDEKNAVNTAPE